jgi:hypothetical protein
MFALFAELVMENSDSADSLAACAVIPDPFGALNSLEYVTSTFFTNVEV